MFTLHLTVSISLLDKGGIGGTMDGKPSPYHIQYPVLNTKLVCCTYSHISYFMVPSRLGLETMQSINTAWNKNLSLTLST